VVSSDVKAHEWRRQAALCALSLLDTEPEEEFDRIARVAQRLLATESAVVSFMDHDRQWYKARAGVDTTEAPRSETFCTHVIADGTPLVVEDATLDPRFADNPHVTADGGVRFYAGVPIHSPGGHAVGTLCVFDPSPRKADLADLAPLSDLAAMVDDIIAARVTATTDELTGVQNRAGFMKAAVRAKADQRRARSRRGRQGDRVRGAAAQGMFSRGRRHRPARRRRVRGALRGE
jgi:GAF domain-containing protein